MTQWKHGDTVTLIILFVIIFLVNGLPYFKGF